MVGHIRLYCYLCIAILSIFSNQVIAFDLKYIAGSDKIYSRPHDLVLSPDQRYLYVADNNNDRIAVLDPANLKLIGSFGEGEVSEPHDVVFQSKDTLLVADTGNSRIAIYKVDGVTAKLTGDIRGAISRPEGVAVHSNGRIYATGAGSGNIVAFENGLPVAEAGGLSSPHDITITDDGSLWVADSGNDRLIMMSETLQVKQILQGKPYHFRGPRYLDIDASGRLYVADKYSHTIKIIAADMALVMSLGSGRGELGPAVFDRPEGVTIRGHDVWFSDTYNDRIVRYQIVE